MFSKDTEKQEHAGPSDSGIARTTDNPLNESGNLSGQRDVESAVLESSNREDVVQDGVKRIEAVSRTWTKWGLIAAYLGYELYS